MGTTLEIVAGRFALEAEAGRGGMGRVYRAHDRASGTQVAVKILATAVDADGVERFQREIELLESLTHPNLVRYVAHGATSQGQPFLAMEWVDGETLSARLKRGPLAQDEAVAVACGIAGALAAAHRARIVHRDVKPANVLLARDGAVKVVDLGIARRVQAAGPTRTGIVVGSCLYMSPEQALGGRDVDERSDVFSLGAVLYECLSGRRAFAAEDATAALAKILLDDPQPLAALVPGLSPEVDALVRAMLAKRPEERPADCGAVLEALERVRHAPSAPTPPTPAATDVQEAFGTTEARVLWVLLARAALDADAETLVESVKELDDATGPRPDLRARAERFGGNVALLADGSVLVSFGGRGSGRDLGRRAARCALSLREVLDGPLAIGTGLAVLTERAPVGDVIDATSAALRGSARAEIRLTPAARDALAPDFDIREDAGGAVLVAPRAGEYGARRLLGRETPCVGRERELELLEASLAACAAEKTARVVVVTGPAGAGKSRLLHELLRRTHDVGATVLLGRCDELAAGAAFAPLADAIRRASRIDPTSPPAKQQEQLLAFARGAVGEDEALRVAEMLGELSGTQFPDDASERLRAARRDTRLLGQAMRTAFEDWLGAASAQGPVVLVLDDFHWGDLPTVRIVGDALRQLEERPVLALVFARPELDARFPALWQERGPSRVALRPLARKAAALLVRRMLGDELDEALVERIVARSEGNPFFLEELIRTAASGAASPVAEAALPETVLATMQARLDALGPEHRRVLRAASIHGARFSQDALGALLGDAEAALGEKLSDLVAGEWLVQTEGGLAFVHALVHETAYQLTTEEDRRLGHRLAGEHMERAGDGEAAVIAEHFLRSDTPERAGPWLLRAAEQALGGNDLARAAALASRALEVSSRPDVRGGAHHVRAEATRFRGDYANAIADARAAIEELEPGTARFYLALGEAIAASAFSGDYDGAEELAARAQRTPPLPGAEDAQLVCLARGGTQMVENARHAQVDALLASLRSIDRPLSLHASAWVSWLTAMRALASGDLGTFVVETESALAAFRAVGEVRNVCSHRTNLAYAYSELGDYEHAERELRSVIADVRRFGMPMVEAYALHNLGNVLGALGRTQEGVTAQRQAADVGARIQDARIEGAARAYLAKALLEAGDPAAAAREHERAMELLVQHPPLLEVARTVGARLALALGRVDDALELAAQAARVADAHGGFEDGETLVRLTHVEALLAAGRSDEARQVAVAAKARLEARASRIVDPTRRESFLHAVRESRELLRLVDELGPAPP
jgi:tetratricopeptide (TPR) repeat protein